MKFTKHQKEIIRRINCGEIYDVYSYLKSFNMIENFKIDKSTIEAKFNKKQNGEKYKVLKQGVSPTSTHMDINTFGMQTFFNKLEDEDFEYKSAELVFDKIKAKATYKEKTYVFDPCDNLGINIAISFKQIKEFISIWSYLYKELYVLEVPKTIRKEEIGLFFVVHNKEVEEEATRKAQEEAIQKSGLVKIIYNQKYTLAKLPEEGLKLVESFMCNSNAPKVDAYKYTDEILKFNEDNFIICDYYLDKKILSTPELELFIKKHFKTSEQVNFYWALVPAYLAIIVSVLIPFLQKQDNTEVIKIQSQLTEIQEEISQLETTDTHLQSVIEKLDKNIEKYDYSEIKELLSEIIKMIKESQTTN